MKRPSYLCITGIRDTDELHLPISELELTVIAGSVSFRESTLMSVLTFLSLVKKSLDLGGVGSLKTIAQITLGINFLGKYEAGTIILYYGDTGTQESVEYWSILFEKNKEASIEIKTAGDPADLQSASLNFLSHLFVSKNQTKFKNLDSLLELVRKLSNENYDKVMKNLIHLMGYSSINELSYCGFIDPDSPQWKSYRQTPIRPTEDSGFFKLLSLLTIFYTFLERPGGLLFIDYPELSLHPNLIRYVQSTIVRELEDRVSHTIVILTCSSSFLSAFEQNYRSVFIVNKYRSLVNVRDHIQEDALLQCSLGDLYEFGTLNRD